MYHEFLSKFLSHSTKKYRRGTLVCFSIDRVPKIFMGKRRGVRVTIFCQSLFLTVPKNFVGQPFCVSENFVYRKSLWIREEGCVSQFLSKCVSDSTKKIVGQPFCVSEKIGYRKNLRIKGGLHYFPLIFFCLTLPKTLAGEPFGFRKFGYRKILCIRTAYH